MSVGLKKSVLYGLGLGLLAGMLIWAFLPRPAPVDMAAIEERPLRILVEDEGETRVRDLYTVSAPVAGRLERIGLEVGDPVSAGETNIAVIRPTAPSFLDRRAAAEAEARVKGAEAAISEAGAHVEQARAQLAYAQAEEARMKKLFDDGFVSSARFEKANRDWQDAKAAFESARAAHNARRMDLEAARAGLIVPGSGRPAEGTACCVDITSPISGTVLAIHQKSSKVVPSGTPLLDIGDPARLEVVVDLLSTDAVNVRPGARVEISGWGGDGILPATVRRIEPAGYTKTSSLGVDEQRVDVVVDLTDNAAADSGMGHGYRVIVGIEVWASDGAVPVVPVEALFRDGSQWAVFLVEDGVARLRTVEIGRRNDQWAEIAEGSDAGELVILHPGRMLEDGQQVVERE